MKKMSLLKYVLIILCSIFLIPNLYADDTPTDYTFYCKYLLKTPKYTWDRNGINEDGHKPFEVTIYVDVNNKKATFIHNKSKIKNGQSWMSDYGFSDWDVINLMPSIIIDEDSFYKFATEKGNDCPDISVKYDMVNGFDYHDTMYWKDSTAQSGLKINKAESSPVYNSNLSEKEKDKYNQEEYKVVYECPEPFTYLKNTYTSLDQDVEMRFFLTSKKETKIKLSYVHDGVVLSEGEEVFDPNSVITEIKVARVGMENSYTVFRFYKEDYNKFFKDLTATKFTCPTEMPKIQRAYEGTSLGYDPYIVGYDEKIFKNNGYGEQFELVEGDAETARNEMGMIYNYMVKVSPKSGVCTDYLGSASEDNTVANLLDDVYDVIKIGSIILVIVLSMLEFSGVVTKSKDELMAAVKKLATRLVILIIILLLPTFIDMLGELFGIKDILCGIK